MAAPHQATLLVIVFSATTIFVRQVNGFSDARGGCPATIPFNSILLTFNEQCYEFVRVERYWDVAKKDCESRGGNLVQIRDSATQKFVTDSLVKLQWNRNGLWIGAHDMSTEGRWVWVTGEKVTWSNWESGQPSCYVPALRVFCAEDCAVLRLSTGKWHDYRCHSAGYTYSYICQYDMLTTVSTDTGRPTTTTVGAEVLGTDGSTPENDLLHEQTTVNNENAPEKSTIFPEEMTETIEVTVDIETETRENELPVQHEAVAPEENTTVLTNENDFIDVQTMISVEETTHIIIGENDLLVDDMLPGFDYDFIQPEVRAAQTGSDSTDDAPKSLTGPIVGVLMGTGVLSALLVALVYLYRKRIKPHPEGWAVGFDNPNYGNVATVTSGNQTSRTMTEVVYDDCSSVAVYQPTVKGSYGTTCAEELPAVFCQPDVCNVAAQRPGGNHYVSFDFADESSPPEVAQCEHPDDDSKATSPKKSG